jgi:hypothetical protein
VVRGESLGLLERKKAILKVRGPRAEAETAPRARARNPRLTRGQRLMPRALRRSDPRRSAWCVGDGWAKGRMGEWAEGSGLGPGSVLMFFSLSYFNFLFKFLF